MKRSQTVLIAAIVAVVAVAGMVWVSVGVIRARQSESVFPACRDLGSVEVVTKAMAEHKADLDRVRAIEGVKEVALVRPCKDQPDKAGIEIRVEDEDARSRVQEAWTTLPTVGAAMRVKIDSDSD